LEIARPGDGIGVDHQGQHQREVLVEAATCFPGLRRQRPHAQIRAISAGRMKRGRESPTRLGLDASFDHDSSDGRRNEDALSQVFLNITRE
jgi:hypothetical protein